MLILILFFFFFFLLLSFYGSLSPPLKLGVPIIVSKVSFAMISQNIYK